MPTSTGEKERKEPSRAVAWPEGTLENLLLLTVVTTVVFRKIFLHPQMMLWGSDLVRGDSAFRAAISRSVWKWGTFPLWDSTIFCGRSMVGDQVYALMNPFCLASWLTPNPVFMGFFVWSQVTLGIWGAFLFARKAGCNAIGAFFTAVAFTLGAKTAGHVFAGHTFLVATALGLPWILWGVENLLEKRSFASACLLGAIAALVSYGVTVHLLYINAMFAGLYFAARLGGLWWDGKRRDAVRSSLLAFVALVVCAGAAAAWWLPIVRQTLLLSARSSDAGMGFSIMGSATAKDLLRFVWPFSGIPTPTLFASDAQHGFFWETASYPGVSCLALALAAFLVLNRDRRILFFGYVALLFLLLAVVESNPVFRAAYYVLPGFKLFRCWGRLFFGVNLALAVMAGLALSRQTETRSRWTFVGIFFVAAQVILIGCLVLSRPSLRPPDGLWMPLFVLLTMAVCSFLWASRDLSPVFWQIACLVLLLTEVVVLWTPHIQVAEARRVNPPLSAAEFLAAEHEKEEFRVLDTTSMIEQDVAARYGLEIVSGYDPGVYARQLSAYKRIWRHDDSDITEVVTHAPQEITCPNMLDIMNAKYLIAFEADLGPGYEMVYRTPEHESLHPRYVHRRTTVLPRAFLVGRAECPREGMKLLDALCAFDPRQACLVEDRPFAGTADFQNVPLERHSPCDVGLSVSNDSSGVLVLSESWHPDWRATDNGNPVEVRRVNHNFLGIPLEAGDHNIRVWYSPWDFYFGCVLSAVSWLALAIVYSVRKLREREGSPNGSLTPAVPLAVPAKE